MGNHSATMTAQRETRARAIARAGSVDAALATGALPERIDTTLSEALVLGLLRQGVDIFLCVLGHGSTEIGEVLRVYHRAGLLRACGVRSEIEASHAAAALRWVTGERAAVVTSIGPGALHALAASLTPASDGLGVWYLIGDETTEDEGPNMQQIPGYRQHGFLELFGSAGRAYSLHTPTALATALRRGRNTVDHAYAAGPYFLLLPLNMQPAPLPEYNLAELDCALPSGLGPAGDGARYGEAAEALLSAERVMVKVGGGARDAGPELAELLELADGVAVTSPVVSGILPYADERNMTVGGSKGSLCGNYAMDEADLLVCLGSRSVCQADCSRTGYPNVQRVINVNADPDAATHYSRTIALVGDVAATLRILNSELRQRRAGVNNGANSSQRRSDGAASAWLRACSARKKQWAQFKRKRYAAPVCYDAVWEQDVLTQPAAIRTTAEWARAQGAVCFYDAGDVQANGFQIVEDERLGQSFTDTGASYMGFAVSALLATAVTRESFYGVSLTGDGSFTMNPQILIDGVEHGARGCIVLLDNRRMGAISALQRAQYGLDYATRDSVNVDYAAWARAVGGVLGLHGGYTTESLSEALDQARAYQGLALIHVPVYFGDNELGGMGVFGRWNVGNWCDATQAMRHDIGL